MLQDFSLVSRLSDAGSNLWALYYLEVMDLQENNDWGGIIELHEEIWFDGMLEYALDPQVFQYVIDAYMNFGFEDEAIFLTRKLRPQQKPYFTEEEEALSFLTTAKIYQQKEKGTGEALATLDLISTKNISAKVKNEIEILRAELLLDEKKYGEAIEVLKRVRTSRQFRLQAQYLLGVAYAAIEDCARTVQEVQPSILSQSSIDDVFSIVHMDGFASCAADQGKIKDAVAYLEYAKIQDITDKERARINYLISEYDGRNFEVPPGSEEEKYLWNKLIKEKEKNKSFTEEFEQWKTDSK
jgi:hypothetical protein